MGAALGARFSTGSWLSTPPVPAHILPLGLSSSLQRGSEAVGEGGGLVL